MVKIIWTDYAILDLEDIAKYIEKDSPRYAKLTLEKIFHEVERIERNPHLGRIVPEANIKNIREIVSGNYRIIYNVNLPAIEILTIHHSARDLSNRDIVPTK